MAAIDVLDAALDDDLVAVDPVAAGALAGCVTGALLVAAGLHRTGHGSMCSAVRTIPGLLGLGVFLLHLARLLGRLDPFDFVSRKIPVR